MEAKRLLSLSGQAPTLISTHLAEGSALIRLATGLHHQDLSEEAQLNQHPLAIPGHSPQCFRQILLPELCNIPLETPFVEGEWKVAKEMTISVGIQGSTELQS